VSLNAKPALLWLATELGIDNRELTKKENFSARMKLQKASFLLHHLDVPPFNRFRFNMYLRGPYSSELAVQYYNLNGVDPNPVLLHEDQSAILRWFASYGLKEMEIATSLMLIDEFNGAKRTDDETYEILTVSKPWVSPEAFKRVLVGLRERKLVR
jgi:hypothetical protein